MKSTEGFEPDADDTLGTWEDGAATSTHVDDLKAQAARLAGARSPAAGPGPAGASSTPAREMVRAGTLLPGERFAHLDEEYTVARVDDIDEAAEVIRMTVTREGESLSEGMTLPLRGRVHITHELNREEHLALLEAAGARSLLSGDAIDDLESVDSASTYEAASDWMPDLVQAAMLGSTHPMSAGLRERALESIRESYTATSTPDTPRWRANWRRATEVANMLQAAADWVVSDNDTEAGAR